MLRAAHLGVVVSAMLVAIIPMAGHAQDVRKHHLGSRAFAFHVKNATEVESTPGTADARALVARIVSNTGTPMNLDVRAAPAVANASALVETIDGRQVRVILYNPTWMSELQRTLGTSWTNASIMAHEIGHHLSGHLDPAYDNHSAELESDRFSGFILQRLGATRLEAVAPMAVIGTDAATSTHPEKIRRMEAAGSGWDDAAAGQGANIIRPVPAVPGTTGARVALLIGNSAYERAHPLKNPKNDVLALQQEFKRLGFVTTTVYDATSRQISEEVRRFSEHAQDADWAVVYFGGQGKEIDGVNYIVPIEADPMDLGAMVRLDTTFEAVRRARTVRLVIADACRDSLLPKQQTSSNLLIAEPPHGIVVAYSTRSGQVALDGAGDNSPYTEALVAAMRTPGMDFEKAFGRVREHVASVTKGVQVPTVLGDWPARDLTLSR